MKSLFSLLVGLFLLSASTHAISLTFKLDIFSSGSDIYACNAGLMHKAYQARVCYDRNNPENSCNPSLCEEGQACNCVCTGDILNNDGQGEFRLDYFTASYSNWADHGEIGSGKKTKNMTAGKNDFNQLFKDKKAFEKELSSLTFNLGSERYGAKYFLDVCYKSTQITYPSGLGLNYSHDKQITVTDLSDNGYNYEDLSGLAYKTVVVCKKKDSSDTQTEINDWAQFNGSQVVDFSKVNFSFDIEKCKVRYLFKETNRTGLESLRRWNLQKARVCTYTSFNEPELN
jgi:hypothetical protein